MIIVPVCRCVSVASAYGESSVNDSNRSGRSIQPRATCTLVPPKSRASAGRWYDPAAPKASSDSSASIALKGGQSADAPGRPTRRLSRRRAHFVAPDDRPWRGEQRRECRVAGGGRRGRKFRVRRHHDYHEERWRISFASRASARRIPRAWTSVRWTASIPRKDEAGVRHGRDALYSSRRVHRLRRLRAGVPGRGDLSLDETPQKWEAFIPENASYYDR